MFFGRGDVPVRALLEQALFAPGLLRVPAEVRSPHPGPRGREVPRIRAGQRGQPLLLFIIIILGYYYIRVLLY